MNRCKKSRRSPTDSGVELKPLKTEQVLVIEIETSSLIDSETPPEAQHQVSRIQRAFNWILCRSDFNEEKLEDDPVELFGLFRFIPLYYLVCLLIGIFAAVFVGFTRILFSYAVGQVTTEFLNSNSTSDEFLDNVMSYNFLFGALAFVFFIGGIFQHVCIRAARVQNSNQMNYLFLKSVLSQDAEWLDKKDASSLNSILRDSLAKIEKGINENLLGELFKGFATYLASLILAFQFQWKLSVLLFIAPVIQAKFHAINDKITIKSSKKLKKFSEEAARIALEALSNVKTLQAFNGDEEIIAKYEEQLKTEANLNVEKDLKSSMLTGSLNTLTYTLFGFAIVWGGVLFSWGEIKNAGDVFTVIYVMLAGALFWSDVSRKLMDLTSARVSAAVLFKIIDRKPEIDCSSSAGITIPEVVGKVEFQNVEFQYKTRKEDPVLKGLNLTVEPGTSVALVGHSGCGKSTMMKLLTRFYDCGEGSIKIDNVDIKELNVGWLRNTIGIVQQDLVLFNDTVRNNLLVANPDASDDDMERCAKMANAHEFIMKLPQGYDTLVGDGGIQLSGGQKQRVAIARTLIRDPKILLLDEATSALDAHSETIVQSALNNAAKGRTTIMIAHRLSTIREADKIVVLDNGVIVESGTHQELVELGGKYAGMVHAQRFKKEEVDWESESDSSSPSLTPVLPPMAPTNLDVDDYVDTTTTEKENTSPEYGLLDIYRCVKGNYDKMFIATVFGCLYGAHWILWPTMINVVFGIFGKPREEISKNLLLLVPMFAAVAVYSNVTRALGNRYFTIVSEALCRSLRVRTLKSLLSQDAAFFDNPSNAKGTLAKRLSTDVPKTKFIVDKTMTIISSSIITILVNGFLGFMKCWQIAVIASAFLVLLGIIECLMSLKKYDLDTKKTEKETSGKLSAEIIDNGRSIQLLNASDHFLKNYKNALSAEEMMESKLMWFDAIFYGINSAYYYLALMICYGSGAYLVYHKTVGANDAFCAIQYLLMCANCVTWCAEEAPTFEKAKVAGNIILKLINRAPATGNPMNGRRPEVRSDVEFDSVKFSYPRRPGHQVMSNLSFQAHRGQTVALVGPSGIGKSTCIHMLERFYDVCSGAIKIDGRDIRTISLHHLRTQMALVAQEPVLFKGTIAYNICFGLKDVPMDKVREALKLANALKFVTNLQAGLDTEVGDKGSHLSGGQKQRIAIARALVRDPKILLLDEATSALDSEAERSVQLALDNARHGRTCITIAHRLSSIQNADVIVYIEDGMVQESGSHRQLMALRGKYFGLIQKQDLAC